MNMLLSLREATKGQPRGNNENGKKGNKSLPFGQPPIGVLEEKLRCERRDDHGSH